MRLLLTMPIVLSFCACVVRDPHYMNLAQEFRTDLQSWVGRPMQTFLKEVGWLPSAVYLEKDDMRHYAFTSFADQITESDSARYIPPARPQETATMSVHPAPDVQAIGPEPSGCRVDIWVDVQGIVKEVRVRGDRCIREQMEPLVKQTRKNTTS